MAGDGVACLCCCGIHNGVSRRDEALRTNGYNATINSVTRDDEGVCRRQEIDDDEIGGGVGKDGLVEAMIVAAPDDGG